MSLQNNLNKEKDMDNFNNVIGYQWVKEELLNICDIIKNPSIYKKLSVTVPRGIMLSGPPGVGKTKMAQAFINECGLPSYVIKKSKCKDEFLKEMEKTFEEAKFSAPSVILLDDMDKFPTDSFDIQEYAVVQSCMDSVKDSNVFVIATVNKTNEIPKSLLRAGRFDNILQVEPPQGQDAVDVIKYYLSIKNLSENEDYEDIIKMLVGATCAEIEVIINSAGLLAGSERCEKISKRHLVKAYTLEKKGADFDSEEGKRNLAYHEAGHAIIAEALKKESVSIVAIVADKEKGDRGFVKVWDVLRTADENILYALGGVGAEEIALGVRKGGSKSDIEKAVRLIKEKSFCGEYGFEFVEYRKDISNEKLFAWENLIKSELSRYLTEVKKILASKSDLLDELATEIMNKNTLLFSDVQRLMKKYKK